MSNFQDGNQPQASRASSVAPAPTKTKAKKKKSSKNKTKKEQSLAIRTQSDVIGRLDDFNDAMDGERPYYESNTLPKAAPVKSIGIKSLIRHGSHRNLYTFW